MRHDSTTEPPSLDDGITAAAAEPFFGARSRTAAGLVAAAAMVIVATVFLLRSGEPQGAQQQPKPTPVRAVKVTRGELVVTRKLSGELVGEATALSPRVSGRLESVLARPGDRVRRGQVVAVIDAFEVERDRQEQSEQVNVLEANLERDKARLVEARSDDERARALYSEKLISDQEMDRLRAQTATASADLVAGQAQVEQGRARLARLDQQLAETRVRAPFAGTVAVRFLDAGAVVQPGSPVVRIVQDRPLLVQFRVPERLLGSIEVAAPFTLTTQATGERRFSGRVVRIAGEVSRTDRTALVEGELDEPPPALHPGMYADVEVEIEALADAILVPAAAIVERLSDGTVATGVFAAPGSAAAAIVEWRPAEVLAQQGEIAAISGAIVPGDRVLTLGHEELVDGSSVLVVEDSGNDSEAPTTASGGPR